MKNKLISKIKDKTLSVGIIGLGYVGLPLSLRFACENIKVTGFDIDQEKTEMLNNGKSYIRHIDDNDIKNANNNGFRATHLFSKVSEVDVIILCLPTPLNDDKSPNLDYVINSLKEIKGHLKKGQLLSLESTTYPGTTEEELFPILPHLTGCLPRRNRRCLIPLRFRQWRTDCH